MNKQERQEQIIERFERIVNVYRNDLVGVHNHPTWTDKRIARESTVLLDNMTEDILAFRDDIDEAMSEAAIPSHRGG